MKKVEKELAERIIREGVYRETSGNDTVKHDWYNYRGFLSKVSYKNGKMYEVQTFGRI